MSHESTEEIEIGTAAHKLADDCLRRGVAAEDSPYSDRRVNVQVQTYIDSLKANPLFHLMESADEGFYPGLEERDNNLPQHVIWRAAPVRKRFRWTRLRFEAGCWMIATFYPAREELRFWLWDRS